MFEKTPARHIVHVHSRSIDDPARNEFARGDLLFDRAAGGADVLADVISIEQAARIQLADENSNIVDRSHQPAELQLEQRFADDALRHAEALGEVLLREALAGAEFARENAAADVLADAAAGGFVVG